MNLIKENTWKLRYLKSNWCYVKVVEVHSIYDMPLYRCKVFPSGYELLWLYEIFDITEKDFLVKLWKSYVERIKHEQ